MSGSATTATTTTPTPEPPRGGSDGGGPLGLRVGVTRALARGWWLFLLRGVAAILFGVLAFLFPVAGATVLLAFLAAWLAVDGVFTLWHAITGPKERTDAWMWLDGIASLAAAALVFFAPGLSLVALVLVAGAWAMASGAVRLWLAFRAGDWLLAFLGGLGIAVGLYLVAAPGPGLVALVWVVAIQALVGGALLVALAIRLRGMRRDPALADGTDTAARAA